MPPKKAATSEEMTELKEALDFMSAEMTTVSTQQKKLMGLMAEVQLLKEQNMEKEKKIVALENRVAELEQYTRMNDLIISGLKTRHKSYARAVSTEGAARDEPTEAETESLEQQVVGFLEDKGISVASSDIEACHTLPSKIKGATPAIIIRFSNRKNKDALYRQGRKLKGTQVYINEHLTKKNADIAKKARSLKKLNKIQWTWTSNCKVFIKTEGANPEETEVTIIRDIRELDKFAA